MCKRTRILSVFVFSLCFSLSHACAGTIVGWGRNTWGEINVPPGNDYAAIAGGGSHGLALRSDESIAGWGFNYSGEATPPSGNDFVAVSAGGSHSLALNSEGSLAFWGGNDLGTGNVPSGNNFVAISAGNDFCIALMAETIPPNTAGFAGGTGTPKDPYQITTRDQLISISSDPNLLRASYILMADIDLDPNLSGGQVFDDAVIVSTEDGFIPVHYSGSFNGNDHSILNLIIRSDNEIDFTNPLKGTYVGLFDVVDVEGSVRNLNIVNANVYGKSFVGILAGSNYGTILRCTSAGIVESETGPAGGLIGTTFGSTNTPLVAHCNSTVNVKGAHAGGLIGEAGDTSVICCSSTASVTAHWLRAGGLIAETRGSYSEYQDVFD